MTMFRRVQTVIQLNSVEQFGAAKTRKLLEKLADENARLEWLLDYESSDLVQLGLTESQADMFLGRALTDKELHLIEMMEESGAGLITCIDPEVHARLMHPRLSPWYFYYGELTALSGPTLGFSGSRDASPEALHVTSCLARTAVEFGHAIVTGGARGVDQEGHTATLDAGGASVVVLPQGLANAKIGGDMDAGQTLVLSEFLPWDEWGSFRAMQRNKSIINLSDCLVIPQSGTKGGTMNAADYALKQEHELWVADLGDDYPGNQLLLKRGARPIPWIDGHPDLETMLKSRAAKPTQQTLF